jgi:hypothetical protein
MKMMTLSTPGGHPLMAAVVPVASPILAATRLIPAMREQFRLPAEVSFSFRDLTVDELSALVSQQPA